MTTQEYNAVNDFAYGVMRTIARQLAQLRLTDPDAFKRQLAEHLNDKTLTEETKAAFKRLVVECAMEIEARG